MPDPIATVLTPRLDLRPLRLADAPTLHAIYQMEDVLRYFPSTTPPSLERVERFIAGQEKHWAAHACGNWGVQLHGASEIIGWAGLQFLPELNETEVGFLLARPHWGQGYATEAARASLDFAFSRLPLDHVIALVHPENIASRHVIEKCGMAYLETLPLWGIELMRFRLDK